MNQSVKQQEFKELKRSINISIDNLNRKMYESNKPSDKPASRNELIQQVKLANAKFDAMEQAINLIFGVLESHGMNITTCTHCNQPLPKANNDK
jgi:hypothetical protein